MTPTLPLVDGNTLLIDNSSLEKFTTCPRSAEYAICHRRSPNSAKTALAFGGIIHKILEARYRACSAMFAQTPEVEKVMMAVCDEEFTKWQPPEDDYRNQSCAVSFINKYGADYPLEPFDVVRLSDGKPFIEVPFAIPLGVIDGINIVWTGRIDLVYTIDDRIYIMDHKTTSMMGPSYFLSFEISHQFYGYAWAVEQLIGKPVHGIMINALGVRRPTKSGKAFEFERHLILTDRDLLAEWKTDCIHIVADFIEMVRRGYLPKHTAWCVGKFGECPFRKVCTLSPAQREIMLMSGEFVENTWSPLT